MNIINQINNESNPKRELSDIQSIIVHHTGSTASDENNAKFLNKNNYISCHYMVGRNGSIFYLMEEDRIAYHCGKSSYPGLLTKYSSLNHCTLGIEVNSDGTNFTDEQRKSVVELIKYLKEKHNISKELILRHRDIAPGRKWDIGDNFWNKDYSSWAEYINQFADKDTPYIRVLKATIMRLNSALFDSVTSLELKDALHKVNSILRR